MKVHRFATQLSIATLLGEVVMIAFAGKNSWLLGWVFMPSEAPSQVATLCICNCKLMYPGFAKYIHLVDVIINF